MKNINRKSVFFYLGVCLFSVLLVGNFSLTLLAQDNEDDIFSEESFDESYNQDKEDAEKNVISYLFGGSVLFTNYFYGFTEDSYFSSFGTLSGSVFAKVSYGMLFQLFASYGYSYPFYYFTDKTPSSYTLVSDLDYNLRELFFDFNIGRYIFLRFGQQMTAWGSAFVWTPVDFINLERYNEITYSSEDTRLGKPGIRLHVPFGKSNIFVFWDLYDLDSLNYDIAETGLGLRLDFTVGGYEIGLSGYFKRGQSGKLGVDFSGTLLNVDIYGEISYFDGIGIIQVEQTSTFPFVSETNPDTGLIQAVLGFSKSFGEEDEWSVSGEFFFNSQGYKTPGITTLIGLYGASALSSPQLTDYFVPFYTGMFYYYISLSKTDFLTDVLNVTLFSYGNITDNSYIISLKTAWTFGDYPTINLSFSYNFGDDDMEFTYSGNNVITLTLSTGASF